MIGQLLFFKRLFAIGAALLMEMIEGPHRGAGLDAGKRTSSGQRRAGLVDKSPFFDPRLTASPHRPVPIALVPVIAACLLAHDS